MLVKNKGPKQSGRRRCNGERFPGLRYPDHDDDLTLVLAVIPCHRAQIIEFCSKLRVTFNNKIMYKD